MGMFGGDLRVTGLTVSCEFGDKNYGSGSDRFFSVSAKVPEGAAGIPLADSDQLMQDGIDMYLTAWQTLLQTRYATGEITADDYKRLTAGFLIRVGRIGQLWQKIKGKSTEELEAFLKKADEPAPPGETA